MNSNSCLLKKLKRMRKRKKEKKKRKTQNANAIIPIQTVPNMKLERQK